MALRVDCPPCKLWPGPVMSTGYGRMFYNGKRETAHRVIWEMSFGPIPPGLCVCHSCDVKLCIEPEHLFLGTNRENILDMWNKSRGYKESKKLKCKRDHNNWKTRRSERGYQRRYCHSCAMLKQTERRHAA